MQQAVEARKECGREVRVLHWQQYKEHNSKGEDWDIFMVGKAWDKLMVQQVNYAAKIYVQKGMWVQLLTILHLVLWKLCSVFFK